MKNTEIKKTNRFIEGSRFLLYGLEIFGVIGFELLWGYVIEPFMYQRGVKDFNTWQMIVHWVVTCLAWGLGALLVVKECKKKSGLDIIDNLKRVAVIDKEDPIKIWQWVLIVIGAVLCLISTWIDWNGSKVIAEFHSRGPILFPFQYIYYLFEVMLVLLIIIFGQMAFEKWFNNNKIPFGGILVALTWGLGHWLTKGSLFAGLYTAVGGFVFGSAYLLTKRNVKLSYILLCIMFIL
jgi:membrane protease YdiL (CAAX protease family)